MPKVQTGISIDAATLDRIDQYAAQREISRSEAISKLATSALDHVDSIQTDIRESPVYRTLTLLAAHFETNPERASEIRQAVEIAMEDFDRPLFTAVPA